MYRVLIMLPFLNQTDAGSGGGSSAAATEPVTQTNTDSGAGNTDAGAAAAAAGSTTEAGKPAGDVKPAADGKAGEQGGATPPQAADSEPTGKAGADDGQPKAPAKYELSIPDGGRLDADDLTFVEQVARANDWTNEEAQAAINEHDAVLKAQADRFLTATKVDPDYGGDKLEQSQRLARQVIDRIRPAGHPRRDSFLKFLNRGGAGNHIEVVAFLADLGKVAAEDGHVAGRGGGGGVVDAAAKLYGEPKST